MRKYLRYSYISVKEYLAYPSNILAELASKFLYLFMQICLWKALFSGFERRGSLSYSDTIRYVAAACVVSILIECNTIASMNQQIRSGDIVNDLLRPMDFKLMMLFKHFGNTMIKSLLIAVPTLLFAIRLISDVPFSSDRLVWGLISVALAYVIHFLYSLVIGMLAFFLIVTWPLNMLFGALYKFLSGIWIPVTMFPELLYRINLFLPFRAVYAIPVSLLTGSVSDVKGSILCQILWLVAFLILAEFVWLKGYKKLVLQGG
jgi:ABC-2 type transport system permease protein